MTVTQRSEKHIMLAIMVSFSSALVTVVLSEVLYLADVTGEFPVYSINAALMTQLGSAFALVALTMLAMKAEEEKQILPAAGFTMQAISYGITSLSFFDLAGVVSFEDYENFYCITISSGFLYALSLLLITIYNRFKKWGRIVSLVSGLPFLASGILFLYGVWDYHLLEKQVQVL